jgi:hypothetical protein
MKRRELVKSSKNWAAIYQGMVAIMSGIPILKPKPLSQFHGTMKSMSDWPATS